MQNNKPLTEQDFDDLINDFIKKWIPEHYPHLVDTDENDGEKLRQDIKEKVQSAKRLLKERLRQGYLLPDQYEYCSEQIDACFQIDDDKKERR
jgi:cell division protein YceG involved in septum cleavage